MSDPSTEAREFVQRFVEGLPTDVQKLRESAGVILAALEQARGALEQAKLEVEERFTKQGAALAEAAKQRRRAEAAERALARALGGVCEEHAAAVWLLRERTGRPVAVYSDRATAIERRVELARRNPSTFPIRATEVVSVVVDPTVDELFDPDALRKPRAPQSTDAA